MRTLPWTPLWLPATHFAHMLTIRQIKSWAYRSAFHDGGVPSDSRSRVGRQGSGSVKSDVSRKGRKASGKLEETRVGSTRWEILCENDSNAERRPHYPLWEKIVVKMEQPEMIHKKLEATRGSEVQGLKKTLPSPLLPFFPLSFPFSLPAQLLSLFLSEALVCSWGWPWPWDPLPSTSRMLGFQAHAFMPCLCGAGDQQGFQHSSQTPYQRSPAPNSEVAVSIHSALERVDV